MPSAAAPLAATAEALWQALAPRLPGLSVEAVAECGSTNSVLLERVRAGDAAPALLVAERQTAGRGRNARPWLAAPGASLTFSLTLPLAPANWGGLSLAAGLAVAEALDPAAPGVPPRIALKWPNDLWLAPPAGPGAAAIGGRKLGGILIESVALPAGAGAAPATARAVVVGVGINLAPLPAAGAGAPLRHGYACLAELQAAVPVPGQVWARVAPPLVHALLAFEQEGFGPLAPAYGRRDLLRGQRVCAAPEGGAEREFVAEGVAADGALSLRDAHHGTRLALSSGEVSLRLPAHAAGA